ncbi:MAG TPA: PIN domain-containing protein [Thermoanaerobaculia bacterium]|nr:PIN domain-containing protein [Thermoanaerobaculia bacterium]
MIAYFDSSVVLRRVFAEENPLAEWSKVTHVVSSVLSHIECRRAVDRMRFRPRHVHRVLLYRKLLNRAFERIEFVRLTDEVILEAAQPLPFSLRSLDAIHLATAID